MPLSDRTVDHTTAPLVEAIDLVKSFPVRRGIFGQKRFRLFAVDRVSLSIRSGETLGLVGESGCGKSTLGLTLMLLYQPTSGKVLFEGRNLDMQQPEALSKIRREMQMIFQDPFASLDPRLTVEQIIQEPLDIHRIGSPMDRAREVRRLLNIVGLSDDAAQRFPAEFSGGQQQRIGIARALALRPKLLICDEPVSSLDVSVQAQILNLLRDLQKEFGLTYIFISHNIAVTGFMSRRIGVMYLGRLMEIGPSKTIVNQPRHPYTQALLSAVPEPDPAARERKGMLKGDVPSPIDRPSGCPFHTRCPWVKPRCSVEEPQLRELSPDHYAACHYA
ncbi:MAG: ATP-binding cassette domain-containing protein [Chloroflexi bacterium]|nr:ATP-binding cassette domain-containing protein [Chloroflexota bacterium]